MSLNDVIAAGVLLEGVVVYEEVTGTLVTHKWYCGTDGSRTIGRPFP